MVQSFRLDADLQDLVPNVTWYRFHFFSSKLASFGETKMNLDDYFAVVFKPTFRL